ncbi:EAP30-like protein [Cynara cardunculus var. scolymus]|uniref:EAP30-like protein n=1 Tax=Cynara cardunculus var. scolymus TaxID=59895 RepID=A0A118G9H2_CYNCS|nr:EAP30-like protein [Cynara cardunculus var. scolymus]
MCAKVGVDPLASNKGFWVELLGIGDFYYELGTGCKLLMSAWLLDPITGGAHEVGSEDYCLRAIGKLKVLGSGFEVITVGKRKLARSVPNELKKDHNEILELSQIKCIPDFCNRNMLEVAIYLAQVSGFRYMLWLLLVDKKDLGLHDLPFLHLI